MIKCLSEMDAFEKEWYWAVIKFEHNVGIPNRELRGLDG